MANAGNAIPAGGITFAQTPFTRFFMCRYCRNHLVGHPSFLFLDVILSAVICRPDVVNVVAGDVVGILRILGFYVFGVTRVFCNRCNTFIGLRLVRVLVPNRVVQEGRFIFPLDTLLYWDGFEVVDALTGEPPDDDD